MLATLLSDQRDAMAERFSGVLNTANDGQKILRLWLGQIEGHLFQLQLSGGGAASCILFGARIEILPIGIYFATVEAQAAPGMTPARSTSVSTSTKRHASLKST